MKPVDYVVTMVTATVCIIMLAVMINHQIRDERLEGENLAAVSHVLTGMVAIVSMYVGTKLR